MTKYYLPKGDFPNPEQFIANLIQNRYLHNIKLWLDKYCPFDEDKRRFNLEYQIRLLRNRKLAISLNIIDLRNYKSYFQRFETLCKSLEQQGYITKIYEGKVKWRLIVGLGHESVYETSITLHRNYSIPIIPASAVKGLIHHYAEKYGKLSKGDIVEIFGTQNKKGKMIFFDALPIIEENRDFVVLDVMNVHYKPYYEGGETPGDWHNPTPIFFLAVEKGTKFRFALASKDEKLAEKAVELLKEAVNKIGIGAKTSAGYGYFEV